MRNRGVAILAPMDPGFSGEVAELYRLYRHGYPPAVAQGLVDRFALGMRDVVIDLGCGTGQLTMALAPRVGAVIGIDPEVDMLSQARRVAEQAETGNVGWMLGSDRSVPLLRTLMGDGSIALVTIAQALHWMNSRALFGGVRPLLREGGGIAVLSNGIPLWLQDTDWSSSVRAFLTEWFGTEPTAGCGTDAPTQQRYADELRQAGYIVERTTTETCVELDFEHLLGGLLSAFPEAQLPRDGQRDRFVTQLRAALGSDDRFEERVPVVTIAGRLEPASSSR